MNEARTETLFDEFAVRYARGERPDVGEYLGRAGAEREELGRMIDRFLEAMPARQTTEEDVILIDARRAQEPPLLVLRLRRRLSRDVVVGALTGQLRLDPAKSDKVDRYYHDLEVGNLDPEPVDRRVWDVLADVLKANVRGLAGLRPELPAAPAVAYHRYPAMELHERMSIEPAATASEPAELDDIDELFLGRRGS